MEQKLKIRFTVWLLVSFVFLLISIYVAQHMPISKQKKMERFHGTWLTQPRVLSDFSLRRSNHAMFSNQQLKGQWTMMFFGFTNCPSICPTTMAELAKMVRLLEEQAIYPLPQVVMASLDPGRDTAVKLDRYVSAFHPSFIGVNGKNERAMSALIKEMGVAFSKVQLPKHTVGNDYTIEHSGTVMLINPKGELTAFFTSPLKAEYLAADYRLLL